MAKLYSHTDMVVIMWLFARYSQHAEPKNKKCVSFLILECFVLSDPMSRYIKLNVSIQMTVPWTHYYGTVTNQQKKPLILIGL